MPRPVPFGGEPFRVTVEGAAGVSRSRARANDLYSPFYAVRMGADRADVRSLCLAYATRMQPGQYFSHHTAALLHGLPIEHPREIHVTAVAPGREPRARGVTGHRIAAGRDRVVLVDGLPASGAIDTWVMLAEYLSMEDLVIVGDALLRRKSPFATADQLGEAVRGASGRRGRRRLVEALTHVRPRTDSPRETRVRRWLVLGGLPEPIVNVSITNTFGGFIGFGDLAYPDFRVLVEYDGGHHFTAYQAQRDVDRLEAIMAAGWRVVRLNKSHSRATMVARVRAALVQRGWRP